MKLLSPNQLKVGMRLVHDVFSGESVLLPQDTVITSRLISALRLLDSKRKIAVYSEEPCAIRKSSRGYELEMLELWHGHLTLHGDTFIESFVQSEASLFCVGNLEVGGDVYSLANIACTGNLIVRGCVNGAVVTAGNRLTVQKAGGACGLPTALVCVDYAGLERKRQAEKVTDEMHHLDENIMRLGATLSSLTVQQKSGTSMTPAEKSKVKKIFETYAFMCKKRNHLMDLSQKSKNNVKSVSIIVNDQIHNNVIVRLNHNERSLEPSKGKLVIKEQEGVICID
ncbi:hypothetical protein [Chrysiogenes arsenatis]|uniref:hypothetical protein n=1 Tax=Chrysiogenes arsenatis TaxID=309797 RepID=UPI0003F67335|nr:hypothetical protein [Chrysiogenes arsenatis]